MCIRDSCTDSTSLFNYAFDNFDTIDVDGTAMTVPKGVTVNDLTTDTAERNGKTLTRYYYSGPVSYTHLDVYKRQG